MILPAAFDDEDDDLYWDDYYDDGGYRVRCPTCGGCGTVIEYDDDDDWFYIAPTGETA